MKFLRDPRARIVSGLSKFEVRKEPGISLPSSTTTSSIYLYGGLLTIFQTVWNKILHISVIVSDRARRSLRITCHRGRTFIHATCQFSTLRSDGCYGQKTVDIWFCALSARLYRIAKFLLARHGIADELSETALPDDAYVPIASRTALTFVNAVGSCPRLSLFKTTRTQDLTSPTSTGHQGHPG
jgi:hypothetical protein